MKQKLITAFMAICLLTVMLAMPVFASENTVSGSCGMYANWTLDLDTGVLEISGTGAMKDNAYAGASWYPYRKSIKSVVIGPGITEIGNSSFYECSYLSEITIPEGVTRIGENAFYSALALEAITLPSSVTSIGSLAFYNAQKLSTVTMSDSIPSIGTQAFDGCRSLVNITMPKNLKTLGFRAFADCWALRTVQFSDKLERIDARAFHTCTNLTTVSMTDSVVSLGDSVFYDARSLISVRLSNNLENLPNKGFYNCKSLRYINIPAKLTMFGEDCFAGCSSLSGVVLPDTLVSINAGAFSGSNLKQLVLPESVVYVGNQAFKGCGALKKIAVERSDCYINTWNKHAMGVAGVTTIYGYPESTAHQYAIQYGFSFQILTKDNLWTDTLPVMDNVTMTEAVGHATGNIVRWEAAEGAKLYQLFRRAASESSWTLVTNTGSTAYKDTSAAAGVKYYYKARARFYDFMGDLDIPAVSAIRPGSSALANVTITTTVGHSTGNILYWNAVSGAKLYQVYRLDNGAWTLLKNTGSLAYKDELAKVGVKTYYKVVARNGDNKSDIGSTTSASAVRQAPVSLSNVVMQSAQGHSTGIIVRWNAVGGASLYQVYRLKSGSSSWELLTNTGSTAYKDTTAVPGVRYYYKVVARYGNLKSSMNIDSVSAVRP